MMKSLKEIFIVLLFLTFSGFLLAENVRAVIVNGNNRIDDDYIISLLSASQGEYYEQSLLNNDLKALYATELFEKITGSFSQGAITINVVENPLIENINIVGNSKIKSDLIIKDMLSKRRTTFSQNRLNIDINRIIDIYYKSGYFSATVSYELEKKDYNRLDITIKIVEGKKTTIDTIKFVGNNEFPKGELESVMLTKENKWWRFLSAGDVYDINRILYDGELLRQFYFENGYPNFSVVSNFSEISLDKGFVVTYVLDEGERYKFGDTSLLIKVLDLMPYEQEIEKTINLLKKDDWFKNSLLQKQVFKIKDKINSLGYQFISVEPQMIFNDFTKRVDIIFVVTEQDRLFINKIDVRGNKRTHDYVIRRELKFSEKDAYDSDRVAIAQRNLYRTGYFSSVNVTDSPSSNDGEINMGIEVEEVSTGSISVGGGFSTSEGLQFEAGYTESNLFGTGNYLGVNFNLSKQTKIYNISLSNPYFLNKELYGSFSIYRKDTGASDIYDYTLYDNVEQGISTSLGYRLTDNISQRWGYSFFYRNVYNVSPDTSLSIRELEGTSFVSSLTHSMSYNTTDNPVFVTKGLDISLSTEYAGLFGDSNYIKNTFKGVWYYSVFENVVFSALGSAGGVEGLNGDKVKVIDKYNLGGSTLRGFRVGVNYGGIGPIDSTTGESLGGKYMFRGSFQLETPMPGIKQYGLLLYTFSDFGTVTDFSKDPLIYDSAAIRVSAGVGLSWRSPAGVISLDIGYPIRKQPQDVTERIFLNFGTRI